MSRTIGSGFPRFSPVWFALVAVIAVIWMLPAPVRAADENISDSAILACYAIADERTLPAGATGAEDTFTRMDFQTGEATVIGLTGTDNIEGMSFGPNREVYAVNGGQVGKVNFSTGVFTALPSPIGTGNGDVGQIAFTDVDSIAYSLDQNIFYAAHRRPFATDVLFAINPATGAFIPNFFGAGIDYLRVPIIVDEGGQQLGDIDDLAIDPSTGILYAAINQGGAGGVLATVDPVTGIATRIATFRYPNPYPANPALAGQIIDDIEGLSFFNDGNFYASSGNNGPDANDLNRLFRIDPTTGQGVVVGAFPAGVKDFEALGCLSAEAFIQLLKATNGPGQLPDDADTPTGPSIRAGDPVTWTYTFTNTGFITLTDFSLFDNRLGLIGPNGISNCPPAGTVLGPGEGFTCTAAGIAQPGQYSNTATITGLTEIGAATPRLTVTDTNPSHYIGLTPAIVIRKLTNGQDANDPNGTDVPVVSPGDVVTWTYIVTNTGQVPLSSVVITDDIVGLITNRIDAGDGDALLEPGERWLYTATGAAVNLSTSQSGAGRVPGCNPGGTGTSRTAYRNLGTVVADTLTASDPSHYCNPPERTLTVAAESLCQNDTPYIHYNVQTNGFTPPDPATAVTLTWQTLEGRNVETLANLPLNGQDRLLLWPGAVLDGNGDPIDWPGWDQDEFGNWFQVATDLRPKLRVLIEVNPSASVTLDYPPGTPTCTAAPNPEVSALGDYVWLDRDQDGVQDDDEAGVEDVTVRLLTPGENGVCDAGDAVLQTTITDAGGFYRFDNLAGGEYCVLFDLPDGFEFTASNQGGNPEFDSDANQQSGLTVKITLPNGVTDLTWDAGIVPIRTLTVFAEPVCQNDTPYIRYNVQTNGFTPPNPTTAVTLTWQTLAGRNVEVALNLPLDGRDRLLLWPGAVLDSNGDPIDWPGWDQDEFGNWFQVATDLRPKLRVLIEVNPSALVTLDYPPGTPTCTAAPNPEVSALGDYVWLDANKDGIQDSNEEGIEGVTVKLLTPGENGVCDVGDAVLQTTITDADGFYRFDNLAGGEYCVQFVPPKDFNLTKLRQGTDPAADSDADPETGLSAKITLPVGSTDLTIDGGLFQTDTTDIDPVDQPAKPVKIYLPTLIR